MVTYDEIIEQTIDPRDQKFIQDLRKVDEKISAELKKPMPSKHTIQLALAEMRCVMSAIHYRKQDVLFASIK